MKQEYIHKKHLEESKSISLTIGDVSLDKDLKSYYIDMRPASIHYTQNIWGGCFDDNGVPMVSTTNGLEYSAINIAQYGFILHAEWLMSKDDNILKKIYHCIDILEKDKTIKEDYAVWYSQSYSSRYKIEAPWASAMVQGEIISFYLRVYQINNDQTFLDAAFKAYNFLKILVKDGGVRQYDSERNLWFEEYPSKPASFVLNGFIYTVFGLYDLHRVTENKEVLKDLNSCIKTLTKNIHKFDTGFWSVYDLQKKELVRYYYQKNVHVPQMEVLFLLTKKDIFKVYKEKWEKELTFLNYTFVKLLYRVQYRIPKLYKYIVSLWKN